MNHQEPECVGLAALTMAEYFRDVTKQDVLLFIDNIFRFVQAGSEVSGSDAFSGGIPTDLGEMGELQERIPPQRRVNNLDSGSLRPSRRFDRPSASNDVCSPGCDNGAVSRASKGIYPAVDPLIRLPACCS